MWITKSYRNGAVAISFVWICFFFSLSCSKQEVERDISNQMYKITYYDAKCKVTVTTIVSEIRIEKSCVYFYHNKDMKVKQKDIVEICIIP